MNEYSENEVALFKELKIEDHLVSHLRPDTLYRLIAEKIFVANLSGPAVETFRRIFKAWQYDQIYRGTPAFEKLFERRPSDYEWFRLSPEQLEKFREWAASFKTSCAGAIGGAYEFLFAPTSIGMVVKVKRGNKEIDLSDYDSW